MKLCFADIFSYVMEHVTYPVTRTRFVTIPLA